MIDLIVVLLSFLPFFLFYVILDSRWLIIPYKLILVTMLLTLLLKLTKLI